MIGLDGLERLAGGAVHRVAAEATRRSSGLHTRSIDVDGLRVVFDEGGTSADGLPVVMLHGFSGDRELWSRIAGRLRGRHLIIPICWATA